ncbi:hypothetical protein MPSEU_001062300 [Mayamaea pseudoterrestris]|nr:hypothetical protein MPSEU_001062300 [Mayamaea pseudoterrestris]
MMNFAARYLRPVATTSAGVVEGGGEVEEEVTEIPPELEARLRGHKVVAYPSPTRGRRTQAPDSSSPRPRSLSESRKAARTKDIVKDVYDRMGIPYDREAGADLTMTRPSRSRRVEDTSSERSRPRSLSKGRIASIWPPPSQQTSLDNSWSFSPTESQLSPTKRTMNATTALAFQKAKPSTNAIPAFGSPAYCKDMLTLMPPPSPQTEKREGSVSPKSALTEKTDVVSETDASRDDNLAATVQQKRLSVKDRINNLSGVSKEPLVKTRYVQSRSGDTQLAAKIASGGGGGLGLVSKVDGSFGEKNDSELAIEKGSSHRSGEVPISKASSIRHIGTASYLPSSKAVAPSTSAQFVSSKRQPLASSAFRRTGPAETEKLTKLTTHGKSFSSNDDDDSTARRLVSMQARESVLSNRESMDMSYHNDDIDRLIDERVQAHVAVIEARMETQLGRFMEEVNREMERMQAQLKELHAFKAASYRK